MEQKYAVGVPVKVFEKTGIIKFYGSTQFAQGEWVGIELDDNDGGKNDGAVNNVRYFVCGENRGLFVRPTAVQFLPQNKKDEQALAAKLKYILAQSNSEETIEENIENVKQQSQSESQPSTDEKKSETCVNVDTSLNEQDANQFNDSSDHIMKSDDDLDESKHASTREREEISTNGNSKRNNLSIISSKVGQQKVESNSQTSSRNLTGSSKLRVPNRTIKSVTSPSNYSLSNSQKEISSSSQRPLSKSISAKPSTFSRTNSVGSTRTNSSFESEVNGRSIMTKNIASISKVSSKLHQDRADSPMKAISEASASTSTTNNSRNRTNSIENGKRVLTVNSNEGPSLRRPSTTTSKIGPVDGAARASTAEIKNQRLAPNEHAGLLGKKSSSIGNRSSSTRLHTELKSGAQSSKSLTPKVSNGESNNFSKTDATDDLENRSIKLSTSKATLTPTNKSTLIRSSSDREKASISPSPTSKISAGQNLSDTNLKPMSGRIPSLTATKSPSLKSLKQASLLTSPTKSIKSEKISGHTLRNNSNGSIDGDDHSMAKKTALTGPTKKNVSSVSPRTQISRTPLSSTRTLKQHKSDERDLSKEKEKGTKLLKVDVSGDFGNDTNSAPATTKSYSEKITNNLESISENNELWNKNVAGQSDGKENTSGFDQLSSLLSNTVDDEGDDLDDLKEKDVSISVKELAKLQLSLGQYQEQVSKLQNTIETMERKHEQVIHKQHEDLIAVKKKSEIEIKTTSKKLENYGKKISDLNSSIESLRLDNEQLNLEKEVLEEQVDILKEELQGAKLDSASKCQAANANSTAGVEELLHQNRALKDALEKLHDARNTEKSEHSKMIRALQLTLESKEAQEAELIELQKWRDEKVEEIAILSEQVDRGAEHEAIVEKLTEQNLDYEEKISALEAQLLKLETEAEQMCDMDISQSSLIKTLEEQLNNSEVELSHVKEEAESFKKSCDEIRDKLSKISNIAVQQKDELAESQRRTENLQNELTQLKRQLSSTLAEKANIAVEHGERTGTLIEFKLINIKLSSMQSRVERLKMLLPFEILGNEMSHIDIEILAIEVISTAATLRDIIADSAIEDMAASPDAIVQLQQRLFEAEASVALSKVMHVARISHARLTRFGTPESLEALEAHILDINSTLLQLKSYLDMLFSILISQGSLLVSASSIPLEGLNLALSNIDFEGEAEFNLIVAGSSLEIASASVLQAAARNSLLRSETAQSSSICEYLESTLRNLKTDLDRLSSHLLSAEKGEASMTAQDVSVALQRLKIDIVAFVEHSETDDASVEILNSIQKQSKELLHVLPKGSLRNETLLLVDEIWSVAIPSDKMPSSIRASMMRDQLAMSSILESQIAEYKNQLDSKEKALNHKEKEVAMLTSRASQLESIVKSSGQPDKVMELVKKSSANTDLNLKMEAENKNLRESLLEAEKKLKQISEDLKKYKSMKVEEKKRAEEEKAKNVEADPADMESALNDSFISELKILHQKLSDAKRVKENFNFVSASKEFSNLAPIHNGDLSAASQDAEVAQILNWLEQSISQVRLNPKVIDLNQKNSDMFLSVDADRRLHADAQKWISLVRAWDKTYELLQNRSVEQVGIARNE